MSSHSRNLVRELERKNREIMRDIHHLKRAHRNQRIMQMPPGEDPSIVTELEERIMSIRVVEFSSGGYKIRKMFA